MRPGLFSKRDQKDNIESPGELKRTKLPTPDLSRYPYGQTPKVYEDLANLPPREVAPIQTRAVDQNRVNPNTKRKIFFEVENIEGLTEDVKALDLGDVSELISTFTSKM